ncbi:MAG: carbohydrate kinase family protein [Clostridiales bacterium]|nr:carbohydrate kinase family protein [Clostridiales bacterium]
MKIIVIGGSNIDIIGKSEIKYVDKTSNPGKVSFNVGGVARNIAEFLSHMGEEVSFISTISKSSFGEMIKKNLYENNIDYSNALIDEFEESIYLSIENGEGEMLSAINQMDSIEKITPSFIFERKEFIFDSKGLVIDTNLSQETIEYIAQIASSMFLAVEGVSVEKVKKINNIYNKINLLKVNEDEARVIVDDREKIIDREAMVKKILSFGVEEVHITLGKEGVIAGNYSGIIRYKMEPLSKVISVNKAGDAYCAGIIFDYLKGNSLKQRVEFGTAQSRKQITGGN